MTDPIIETAVRKLNEKAPVFIPMEALVEIATMVVTVVTPLIEAAALERAAVIIENDDGYSSSTAELAAAIRALKEQQGSSAFALKKRPVAFRVKDFADGWVIFQDEEAANREAEQTGAIMQGLYVRDGQP